MLRPLLYQAFGLSIRSAVRLPGAMVLGASDAASQPPADIDIVEGPASLRDHGVASGPYRLVDDTLLFESPGIARYVCERGRRIVVERAAGAEDDDVSLALVATALPATLWMRGEIVLHAAAAVLPGDGAAVLIGGRSGSGKSTVLHHLATNGAAVVADDAVCVRVGETSTEVSGLAASYLLRTAASVGDRGRVSWPVAAGRQRAEAACGAFVTLVDTDAEARADVAVTIGLTRLPAARALETLLASRHRPTIPRLLRRETGLLDRFARLVQQVPVFAWSRARETSAADDGRELLSALAAIGRGAERVCVVK